jgi:hypothetical protein
MQISFFRETRFINPHAKNKMMTREESNTFISGAFVLLIWISFGDGISGFFIKIIALLIKSNQLGIVKILM